MTTDNGIPICERKRKKKCMKLYFTLNEKSLGFFFHFYFYVYGMLFN